MDLQTTRAQRLEKGTQRNHLNAEVEKFHAGTDNSEAKIVLESRIKQLTAASKEWIVKERQLNAAIQKLELERDKYIVKEGGNSTPLPASKKSSLREVTIAESFKGVIAPDLDEEKRRLSEYRQKLEGLEVCACVLVKALTSGMSQLLTSTEASGLSGQNREF